MQIRYTLLPMTMARSNDQFATGMVHWSESELELTPSLDRWQYALLRPHLGRKLLEVGAGAGRITALVAEAGCHDELVAVEPSAHFFNLLRIGAGKSPKTTLMETVAEKLLPQYREHFDSVYSVHVMEHIQQDRQFLETQLALTRPGGNVIVMVPALPFLFSELDRNIGHYRRYNKRMVRTLVRGLPVEIRHMAYNNLLGVLGSLYFSKFRKINYQKNAAAKSNFNSVYHFFSEYVVPGIRVFERIVPVPLGLNLTIVLRKRTAPA
jgi:2-polyprenyl-3-methyl-5-hydroxy-6-metoxy-1,4-benzoquinol methylase